MPDRHFTLEEARGLVPWLQQTFDAIAPLQMEFQSSKTRIRSVMSRVKSNGSSHTEEYLKNEISVLEGIQERIDEHVSAITDQGMVLRSVERGLIDFPTVVEGRTVHLCWLAGESDITYWHEVDAGFAERQIL